MASYTTNGHFFDVSLDADTGMIGGGADQKYVSFDYSFTNSYTNPTGLFTIGERLIRGFYYIGYVEQNDTKYPVVRDANDTLYLIISNSSETPKFRPDTGTFGKLQTEEMVYMETATV